VQIAILGPLEVSLGGRKVALAGARLRTLLVRLAVDAPKPVPIGELIEAVWDDEPPADAANALQSLVSRLRRAFGEPALITAEPAGYRLEVDRSSIDLHRFAELAGQAGRLQRQARPEDALEACTAALALWRGEPLLDAGDAPYAHPIVTACLNYRVEVVSTRIDALLDLGRGAEVISELDELIDTHPLRERFVAQQLRALAATGRVNEALAAYEKCRRRLADELGSDPGPELQQLHLALLRGDLPVVAARPSPPPKPEPRTNLRAGLTSFIGRKPELARIAEALESARLVTIVGPGGAGKTRIATEAALQWMRDHDQPSWMVELAPIGTPENIPGALLGALGLGDPSLRERSERTGSDELQRLLDHLSTTQCLLVVDNCEHLIDGVARLVEDLLVAAPGVRVLATSREPLALTAETLCPLPPLRLPPDEIGIDQATRYAAVRLWVDRASAIVGGYRLDEADLPAVMEILRRLDGLPLAIELAAARLRVLPVSEIARLLSDRFRLLTGGNRTSLPRHRTLRAVVEWSWDLLSDSERLLAERLAIFPAGAGIESATAICADQRLQADEIGDLMINLADKSLLEPSDGAPVRFRMLETIREYGAERLAERSELAAARARHADYFYDLVLELEPQLRDHRQRAAREIMDTERGNVLAALRFLIDGADPHRALIMVLALYWQYQIRDQETELGYWLGEVIAANEGRDEPLLVYAEAIHKMSNRELLEFDSVQARAVMADLVDRMRQAPEPPFAGLIVLREQLPIYLGAERGVSMAELVDRADDVEDRWVRGAIYAAASWMAENLGDREQMARFTDAAYDAFSRTGDVWGLSAVLGQRAQLLTLDGETDKAIEALHEVLNLAPEIGSGDDVLLTHLRLAALELRRGRTAAAREQVQRMRESNRNSAMERERELLCGSVEAAVLVDEGRTAEASDFVARMRAMIDDRLLTNRFSAHASSMALASGAHVELAIDRLEHPAGGPASGESQLRPRVQQAIDDLRRGYAAALATEDVPILAEFAVATAAAAQAVGDDERAARLLGGSAGLVGIDRLTDPRQVGVAERLRADLGDVVYEELFAAGRALDRAELDALMDPARFASSARVETV